MLFSNDTIAKFLNREFECAWEMVRPVPKVEIDFGDGRRLRRTLSGNIATYFCLPDGRTYDLLPGLVSSEEFLRRVRWAHELYGKIKDNAEKRSKLATLHEAMADVLDGTAIKKPEPNAIPDVRKRVVEAPLKKSLRDALRTFPELTSAAFEVTLPRAGGVKSSKISGDAPTAPTNKGAAGDLRADTEYNRAKRYPVAHRILTRRLLETPSALSNEVFRDCLHMDLDDPYLGLAPYVLGGEHGRDAD